MSSNLSMLKAVDDRLTRQIKAHGLSEHVSDWFYHHPWPAWLKSLNGRMLAINPTYRDRYGVSQDDYVGASDREIWPEWIATNFGANDKEVAESLKARTYVERFINPRTGDDENVLVCKFPVFDGPDLIGVGGFAVYLPT